MLVKENLDIIFFISVDAKKCEEYYAALLEQFSIECLLPWHCYAFGLSKKIPRHFNQVKPKPIVTYSFFPALGDGYMSLLSLIVSLDCLRQL